MTGSGCDADYYFSRDSVTGAYKCCQDCDSDCESFAFHFNDYYDQRFLGNGIIGTIEWFARESLELALNVSFLENNSYSEDCSGQNPEVSNFTLYMNDWTTGIDDNATCVDYFFNGTQYSVSRSFSQNDFTMYYYQGTGCESITSQNGTAQERCNTTDDPFVIVWQEGCHELNDLTCLKKRAKTRVFYNGDTTSTIKTTAMETSTMTTSATTASSATSSTMQTTDSDETDNALVTKLTIIPFLGIFYWFIVP